jgi:hypothetical protein
MIPSARRTASAEPSIRASQFRRGGFAANEGEQDAARGGRAKTVVERQPGTPLGEAALSPSHARASAARRGQSATASSAEA